MHCSWVHFVREPQGFQNTRTLFFERVTAVTEYYVVLERVVQPKESRARSGPSETKHCVFLVSAPTRSGRTAWSSKVCFMYWESRSIACLTGPSDLGKVRSRFIRGLRVNITEGVRFTPLTQRQVMMQFVLEDIFPRNLS